MSEDRNRAEQARRLGKLLARCLVIGISVLPWIAGVPRLAAGVRVWWSRGADASVDYPPGRYKGRIVSGWSEPAGRAMGVGASYVALGAAATGGLIWWGVRSSRRAGE